MRAKTIKDKTLDILRGMIEINLNSEVEHKEKNSEVFMRTPRDLWLKGRIDRRLGSIEFYYQPRIIKNKKRMTLDVLDGDGELKTRYPITKNWYNFGKGWERYGKISMDNSLFGNVPIKYLSTFYYKVAYLVVGSGVRGYGERLEDSITEVFNPSKPSSFILCGYEEDDSEFYSFKGRGEPLSMIEVFSVEEKEDGLCAIVCVQDFGHEQIERTIEMHWCEFILRSKFVLNV